MSQRWWLLGVVGLVLVGLLVACGSSYNSSTDGLLIVGSQGSALLETFSFTLNKGSVSAIANTPTDTSNETCVLPGQPQSMVIDPAGQYVYTILQQVNTCSNSQPGILAFKVSSGGSITQVGNVVTPNSASVLIQGTMNSESVATVPNQLFMDSAGKFLFVANLATTDPSNNAVPGSVSVFTVSSGTLTEVAGSPFFTSSPAMTTLQAAPNIVAVAASPTVFPGVGINGTVNSVCQVGANPPTGEYLYAVDSINYKVYEFSVDETTGVLSFPPGQQAVWSIATDAVPAGVAVDPCDRFVYVTSSLHNTISGYQLCAVVLNGVCPNADGTLVPIAGSPFALSAAGNGPGPIVVDPYGNNVYALDLLANAISVLKISSATGSLAAASPPTVATGVGPTSIVIRGDDSWLFVANHGSGSQGGSTVSQYAVTPVGGALTALPPIQTDNYPWGLAVK